MLKRLLLLLVCAVMFGCAHSVDFNTPAQHQHSSVLPLSVGFYMDDAVKSKTYSSRAASSGVANRWDVPAGKVTHDYAVAYLKGGFKGFTELDSLDGAKRYDAVIKITDINYYMQGQAAHSDITIVALDRSGKRLVDRKYHADGPSGFGRVILGGAFAQKSAIRQSTHVVMEKIFKDFMGDFRANHKR